jgi:hypothetical protein
VWPQGDGLGRDQGPTRLRSGSGWRLWASSAWASLGQWKTSVGRTKKAELCIVFGERRTRPINELRRRRSQESVAGFDLPLENDFTHFFGSWRPRIGMG